MVPWSERPIEVANLFNPAFCSLLLRQTVTEYQKVNRRGLDYPIIFLVLPVILSKFIREALPATTRTKLHIWLQDHQEVRVDLDIKIKALSDFTKEAVIFGMQNKVLAFNEAGALIAPKIKLNQFESNDSEAAQCLERAGMIGRWFANVNDTISLLSMWGIKL